MKVVREIVPREKIDMIKNFLESITDDSAVEVNSVCKWTFDDSFEFVKSSCGSKDTYRIDFRKFRYCPYCGKKLLTN